MPKPGGFGIGPGESRLHQEVRPSCARTCNRRRCCSCVGQKPNNTSGRAGSNSSSSSGRSLKPFPRLMSACSTLFGKADRQLSTRKPNGWGAGRKILPTGKGNFAYHCFYTMWIQIEKESTYVKPCHPPRRQRSGRDTAHRHCLQGNENAV